MGQSMNETLLPAVRETVGTAPVPIPAKKGARRRFFALLAGIGQVSELLL